MLWFKRLVAQTSPISKLDLTSFESFTSSLKLLSKQELQELQGQMDQARKTSFMPDPNWKKLYHGAPYSIASMIKEKGFEVGEGKRQGFMGWTETVQNQGIFLTDNPSMARFFGENRSDDPRDANVVACYVDVSKLMSFQNVPRDIVNLGLSLVNTYNKTRKTRLAIRDWWWLMDNPTFVEAIKKHGFTGVSFREDPVLKMAGMTYLIFDPSTIKVEGKRGDGVLTVKDFYEHLKKMAPPEGVEPEACAVAN